MLLNNSYLLRIDYEKSRFQEPKNSPNGNTSRLTNFLGNLQVWKQATRAVSYLQQFETRQACLTRGRCRATHGFWFLSCGLIDLHLL